MEWLVNLPPLLVTIVSNGLIVVIASAFLKHHFDKKMENSKRETAIYLMKHQTLHTKRAEAIEEIYSKLEQTIRHMNDVIRPIQSIDNNDHKKRVEETAKIAQDFKNTYSAKKIYLPLKLANKLRVIDRKLMTIWVKFYHNNPDLSGRTTWKIREWDTAWKMLDREVPKALTELEQEFRRILHSTY